jgi:DNA-binding IscR family transcriptional regulator
VAHGLLFCSEDTKEKTYVLARDPSRIRVCDVLDAVRGTSGPVPVPSTRASDERIDRVLTALNEDVRQSPNNRTLRELATEHIADGGPS